MRNVVRLTFAVLTLTGLLAAAQDLIVDVNLAILDVFVEDEDGRPVLDLTADAFEVIENGQARAVRHLSLEREAVTLGFVVDRSSSINVVKHQIDQAVLHLLKKAAQDDQVFLMTFAGNDKLDVGLTTTHRNIFDALKKAKLEYGTRLFDAISDSIRYVSRNGTERKALVILSDGADHYSRHTLDQVLNSALFNGISIYVIGYAGDDSRTASKQGWREVQEQFAGLASMTDGKAFFPASGDDCAVIAQEIAERVHYQYRLGFYHSEPYQESSDLQVRLREGRSGRISVRGSRSAMGYISE